MTDILAGSSAPLNGISITIYGTNGSSSTPCTTKSITFHRRHNTNRIMCTEPITGRYVRITMPNKALKLTLCEVEVYGKTITGKLHQHLITVSPIAIAMSYSVHNIFSYR